jgi:uncharacterized protein (DUF1697 family)
MSGSGHRRYVILLRAIGPVTHRLMSMAAWRDAAEKAEFQGAATFGNTGNMLADFHGSAGAAAEAMTKVLRGFGLGENVVPIVRPISVLTTLAKALDADVADPSQAAVYFFATAQPDFSWLKDHDGPERIRIVDEHLVVDFTRDANKSGRLIRQIEKNCGVSTARNWNTVRGLAKLAAAQGKMN